MEMDTDAGKASVAAMRMVLLGDRVPFPLDIYG